MKGTSLTFRLALLVGLLGLLQAVLVLAFSYSVLERELDAKWRSTLHDKATQARHFIGEMQDEPTLRDNAYRLVELVTGQPELHMAVARPGADEPSVGFSKEARESLSRLKADVWATDAYLEWRSTANGKRMLSLATSTQIKNGQRYEIVLSADRARDDQLLYKLLGTMLTAAPFALALVSVGALAIVRIGLAPLRQFRRAVSGVSVRNLSTRIAASGLPSELMGLCLEFNAMLDRLEDGTNRLSSFSSDLAHEIRTPLSILLGRTQVALSQERDKAALLEVLEGNIEELQRLSKLVSDMLFLAQAVDADRALTLQPCDLRATALKVAEFLELSAEEKGLTIEVEGRGQAVVDPGLIERALINLISNAIRHGAADSAVRVSVGEREASASIEVANQGAPIAAEHQERLFDRFYRVDPSRDRDSGGTGLGLAIVKAIMDLHRGAVSVRSSQAGETVFRMEFPRSDRAATASSSFQRRSGNLGDGRGAHAQVDETRFENDTEKNSLSGLEPGGQVLNERVSE